MDIDYYDEDFCADDAQKMTQEEKRIAIANLRYEIKNT